MCGVAAQRQIKDNFSASYAFSCLGKIIMDFSTFHIGLQQRLAAPWALESWQLSAIPWPGTLAGNQRCRACPTTTGEGSGQTQGWQPASAQSLGHQPSAWWWGRSKVWKLESQAAGQGQDQGQWSPGGSTVMRCVWGQAVCQSVDQRGPWLGRAGLWRAGAQHCCGATGAEIGGPRGMKWDPGLWAGWGQPQESGQSK